MGEQQKRTVNMDSPPGPQGAQRNEGAPTEPPKEKAQLSPTAVNLLLLELLSYLCRAFFYLIPVYLAGYLGLGVSWVLFGLLLWMWFKRNKDSKIGRLSAAYELLENERHAISKHIGSHQLPAWVHFPDVERVEWLNKILDQAWPYFGRYVEKMLQEKVVPLVRATNVHLNAFTFTKIDFGKNSPKVSGIKAYTKETDKREVILDVGLSYAGDCEVNVEVKKMCKAGVKGMQIHGTLRIILAPLLSEAPFVGAVTMFFIQKPHLDIYWTGLTNLLEIPGLSDMSDTMIVDAIASHLVLPNRLTIPLMSQINVAQLRFPLPCGVLRVHLIEAEKLVPKDTYLKGIIKGKSDPYAIARVGNQKFKSKTIKENLNPKWNEKFEFVVHEVPGQDLEMDFYDEDPDKDDFLGSLVIRLQGVMADRVVDEWFPLSDIASGQVHLKMEWHSLLATPEKLCEANGQATAMAVVYVDSASNLPNHPFEYSNSEYGARKLKNNSYVKKTDKDPNTYVLLCVGNKSMKSKICCSSKDPVWEQAFAFFIQNVHAQHLHVEVKDEERQCALGVLNVPLHRLLKDTDMTLDQRFHLDNSGPNSFIKMKIVLRVLCIEEPDANSIYSGISALKKGPVPLTKPKNDKNQSKPQQAKEGPKTSSSSEDFLAPPAPQVQQARKPSSSVSEKPTIEKVTETKPLANSGETKPLANSGETKPLANSGSRTPLTPMTPNLRHLKVMGPSMASLNSFASTCFDASDGDLANGTSLEGVSLGEIQLTMRYASLRQCLIIMVNGCKNLLQCSSSGSDPYVRMYLLPDRTWAGRKRTSIKRKTLNPQYEEKFEFFVSPGDIKRRTLDIAVKNNRSFVSQQRKELGKVLVDLSKVDLAKGFTEWFELTLNGQPRRTSSQEGL